MKTRYRGLRRCLGGALLLGLMAAAGLQAEDVAIKVENQKGKPIEGATVTVRDEESGTPLDSALTSTEGIAVIQQLTPGEWYFEVDRPGFMLYTAYVQVRAGKKPELGFASQVSRGDDWEPMRIKFQKASPGMMRKAVISGAAEPRVRETVRVEPESRPEQRPAPQVIRTEPEADPAAVTTAVPSTVEDVEPVAVSAGGDQPQDLSVAGEDPEPLAEATAVAAAPLPAPEPAADTGEGERADAAAEPPVAEPAAATVAGGSVTASASEKDAPAQAQVDAPAAEPEPTPEPTVPEQPTQSLDELDIDDELDPAPEPSIEEAIAEPIGQVVEDAGAAASEAVAEPLTSELAAVETVEKPAAAAASEPAAAIEPRPTPSTPLPRPAPSRDLRSAAAGSCAECAAGEWAASARLDAATAGDTRSTSACPDDLEDRVSEFARQLAERPQGGFAGPLLAALWNTPNDEQRGQLAEVAASFTPPTANCQVAGVVLPSSASMTGYALEAWDDLGGRACSAEGICALPKAGWSGRPIVISGSQATVVFSIFRNRSTRQQRSAELTVLFEPPPEWR